MALNPGAFTRLATDTVSGLLSAGAQNIGGVKTFKANPALDAGVLLTAAGMTFGAGGFFGANPAWVTTNTTKFIVQNGAPISGFAGIDMRASAAIYASSGLGGSNGETAVRVGSTLADAALHANGRLLSVRSSMNGTEVEKFWITKNGPNMTSSQAFELNGDGGGIKLQYRTSDGMCGLHNGAAAYLGIFPGTGASGCGGSFHFGATPAANLSYSGGTFQFAGTYSVGAGGYYYSTNGSNAFYAAASGGFSASSIARMWSEQATADGAVATRLGTMIASPNDGVKLAQFVTNAANASPTEKAFVTARGEFESAIAGAGVVLKSPDGTRWRLTISNAGAVTVAAA